MNLLDQSQQFPLETYALTQVIDFCPSNHTSTYKKNASYHSVHFWIISQVVKNNVIGIHINVTISIYFSQCKGLPCLSQPIYYTLDLSTRKRFTNAIDILKSLSIIWNLIRRENLATGDAATGVILQVTIRKEGFYIGCSVSLVN